MTFPQTRPADLMTCVRLGVNIRVSDRLIKSIPGYSGDRSISFPGITSLRRRFLIRRARYNK